MKFLTDFLHFIKFPRDDRFDGNFSTKWQLFIRFLLLEIAITFIVIFPLIYLVDLITPLRSESIFDEDSTIKIFIIGVFLVPFFEEFVFRYILRYSGLVEEVMSRDYWDKVFPYLVYSLSITFAFVHVSNFDNTDTLFYVLAPVLILSQLIGGFVITYLRVRLNFWWAFMYHAVWNCIFIFLFPLGETLFNKPVLIESNSYNLSIEEKPFISNNKSKFIKIYTLDGRVSKVEAQQYLLQPILDSLYGKGIYYVDSYYLDFKFHSKEGVDKDNFIHLLKEEFDIISLETEKRLK